MTLAFVPKLEILPPAQRLLWGELGEIPEEFTLYGGTAIALHLGHRSSVDFDFFGSRAFDPDEIYRLIPFLRNTEVTQRHESTLTCLVNRGNPVQVSFFGVPAISRVADPVVSPDNNLKIASRLDLAGTKMSVVQKRAEIKDYTDIDSLITSGVDLGSALAAAQLIYGRAFNPQISLKALSYYGDGNLRRLPKDLKARLLRAVREVDLARLPVIHVPGTDTNRLK